MVAKEATGSLERDLNSVAAQELLNKPDIIPAAAD